MQKNKSKIKPTAYIKFYTEILEQILIREFTPSEILVILMIIRLSIGCDSNRQKFFAKIPNKVDFTVTGVDKTCIGAVLKGLIEANVIFYETDTNIYAVNNNTNLWKKNYKKNETSKKHNKEIVAKSDLLKELISNNLNTKNRIQQNEKIHIAAINRLNDTDLINKYIDDVSKKSLIETLVALRDNIYRVGYKNSFDTSLVESSSSSDFDKIKLYKIIHSLDVQIILKNEEFSDKELEDIILVKFRSEPNLTKDKSNPFKRHK